jgi:hypothetical protein
MAEDEIRKAAYEKWEREGRPEGKHDRHWLESEQELRRKDDLPKTWSPGGPGGTVPPSEGATTSDAIPSDDAQPGRFKPRELASENK